MGEPSRFSVAYCCIWLHLDYLNSCLVCVRFFPTIVCFDLGAGTYLLFRSFRGVVLSLFSGDLGYAHSSLDVIWCLCAYTMMVLEFIVMLGYFSILPSF